MRIRVYNVADLNRLNILAYLCNNAGILVSDDGGRIHSLLCIIIPMLDMYIGSADSNCLNTDKNFVITHFGNRLLGKHYKAVALLFFNNAFHHFHCIYLLTNYVWTVSLDYLT